MIQIKDVSCMLVYLDYALLMKEKRTYCWSTSNFSVPFSQFSVCRPDKDDQGVQRRHRHYCDVTLNASIECMSQISSTWELPDLYPSKKSSVAS